MKIKLVTTFLTLFASSMTLAQVSNQSCVFQHGSKTYYPKIECTQVVKARINIQKDIGRVNQDHLTDAKICFYDQQVWGGGNPSAREMSNRDKIITVRLLTSYDNGYYSENYDRLNLLAVYNNYLTRPSSQLVAAAKEWQNMESDDTLKVKLDNRNGEVDYFIGFNSYLTLAGLRYKDSVSLSFTNCRYY